MDDYSMFSMSSYIRAPEPAVMPRQELTRPVSFNPVPEQEEAKYPDEPVVPKRKRTLRLLKKPKEEPVKELTPIENIKNDFLNHGDKIQYLKDNRDKIKSLTQDDKKDILLFFKDYTNK